jgi:predicted O-linked N-acetylglucosamine transferase (SPINDLY family)
MTKYPMDAEPGLRETLAQKGLSQNRLIMGEPITLHKEVHLRRSSVIDLFLDPILCGGHTTTMDVVYGGAPVLCMLGDSFHNRVTASMNNVLQMPCLIAKSRKEYKEIAIKLGLNPTA